MGAESLAETARLVGGRYELEALIGKGGVGEVWRARHVALNSRVAIKFLQLASAEKDSAERRFTTEAQITAQLNTAHAVHVFDFGVTEDGQPYLVMELLEGETLGRRLERVRRLSIVDTVRFLGQAARALHRAHALGIVHRDFKPDNIVISPDEEGRDQVKVLDFGIAKLLGVLDDGAEADEAGTPAPGVGAPSFTRTGAVLGTPLYMAPEQIRNPSAVNLKADIWAFGVVAFECLTGRTPFTGHSLTELFEHIQASQHASAAFLEPSLPAAFDQWFDIACAPDPAKRFINASVAWKRLTLALETEGHSRSGSFPGLDSYEVSGQRRVVVAPGEERADASAPTVDGRAGELLARTHDDEFHSLRRIPRDALTPPSRRAAPRMTVPVGRPAEDSRSARPRWLAAVILVLSVLAGVTAWRVTSRPSTGVGPAPIGSFPSPAPTATPSVDGPSSSPAASREGLELPMQLVPADVLAAAPTSAARPAGRAAGSTTRPAPTSSRATAPAGGPPGAAPPAAATDGRSAPTTPASSAAAAFDPGSYR